MATACSLYDEGLLMGTGTIADGSPTVSGWTQDSGWTRAVERKNIQVQITGAGDWQGRSYQTRITADNGATLTLLHDCPFVGA